MEPLDLPFLKSKYFQTTSFWKVIDEKMNSHRDLTRWFQGELQMYRSQERQQLNIQQFKSSVISQKNQDRRKSMAATDGR